MNTLAVTVGGHEFDVDINWTPQSGNQFVAQVNGQDVTVILPDMNTGNPVGWMIVDDKPYEIIFDENLQWLRAYTGKHHIKVRDKKAAVARPESGDGRVKAPIPGLIARVLVKVGQKVESGDPLVVLEAMKMENEIRAPRSGTVVSIRAKPGNSVLRNDVLAEVA